MSQIDTIKEIVHYEQLLRENSTNHVLKGEYLIRDSQYPDMKEVLGVDAEANITNKEILGDKVMVEGNLNYIVFYLPKDDAVLEHPANKIQSVIFTDKFANYLDLNNDENNIWVDVECEIEHIEANWMNERKVGINGVIELKWQVYKNGEFECVKDIEGKEDIQTLKKEEELIGIKGEKDVDLMGKTILKATMDKPEIDEILKCELNIHKKEIKLVEDKFYVGCYCKINLLYKARENNELVHLEDDIYLSKEEEMPGVNQDMIPSLDLRIRDCNYNVELDDLGENRIVNIEFILRGKVKVYSNEKVEMIKDAYSPTSNIEIRREEKNFGDIMSIMNSEVIVKDNIKVDNGEGRIEDIICASARPYILEKSMEDNRLKIEGLIKLCILYKIQDEELNYGILNTEVPFSTYVDIKDSNSKLKSVVKSSLENLDTVIEGNSISVRGNIGLIIKLYCNKSIEAVADVVGGESEEKEKKASIIIYVVGEDDTLWELAKEYNTTVAEIIRLNDLDEDAEIKEGMKLIIPGRAIF
ncbi:DUF3794 and LysM peptidoglycan-binding domain-containing protein [Caproiciproducens sp. MSJ-32]|uniref:DUF3794 and LysM peptidoglycan-binding domain-containing protein n=1 Tax=Caproiciproducens sp. MSJ-32 TaxID=2841527 RepID=UPI001C114961|nr:SPOCS domain-containing protein [Caproiciproducens sp. MSJ-32]MBU5455222.1 DUF3794 domain-containing protein [Caproiciproducens sp. MSJ-32]